MKNIGRVFTTGCLSWQQSHAWDAVSNNPKYTILTGTQLIQLYKFVCIIPTQNISINLHSQLPFSRLFTTYLGKGSDAILGPHHKAVDKLMIYIYIYI